MASPHERALQCDVQPKTKSDSQWLHDMGYRGGLHEFCIDYGFKPHNTKELDRARDLLQTFREEQQEEWEALRRSKAAQVPAEEVKPDIQTVRLSSARKQELVQQAILWHRRMGHLDYEQVFRLQKMTTGMPSFEGLEVRDIPPCDTCARVEADIRDGKGFWQ